MTSFEHLVGKAILSSDTAERQAAEDAPAYIGIQPDAPVS